MCNSIRTFPVNHRFVKYLSNSALVLGHVGPVNKEIHRTLSFKSLFVQSGVRSTIDISFPCRESVLEASKFHAKFGF